MAFNIPIRGGVDPAATTDTTLLTATDSAVTFVTATNRTASPILIRVAIRPLGAALANTHYDLYDFSLDASDTIKRGPFSLKNTDIITIRASAANTTFRYDGWSAS